jgi:hypothetical protein
MNICVYCSASTTIASEFFSAAKDLATHIAERGDTLVYGGASVGLMGEIARTIQAGGGHVIGVIPQALVDREIAYHNCNELIITRDMRERKAIMEARAQAFIALPGGIGTLDEVFEIINLRQLKLTTHPLVMLNQNGFYDPLIALLQHMQNAKFLRASLDELCFFAHDVASAIEHIDQYRAYSRIK